MVFSSHSTFLSLQLLEDPTYSQLFTHSHPQPPLSQTRVTLIHPHPQPPSPQKQTHPEAFLFFLLPTAYDSKPLVCIDVT